MRLIVFLFCASTAFAQSAGTVTGTVLNLPGDPVPNAPIQATNVSTSAVYKAASSEKGEYTLSQLPPGTYEVAVSLLGYNPYLQKNVSVASAKALHLDIHLIDYQFDTLGDGKEFRIDLLTPHPTPSGPTPRTREGKPDLSGVWYAQRTVDPGKPEDLRAPIQILLDAVEWEELPKQETSGLPHATHRGVLRIVDTPLRVYQLSDGQRIFDADDLLGFFGGLTARRRG